MSAWESYEIIVPRTVSVTASARAKAGEVYVLSRHDDGRNAEVTTGSGGLLVIDAKVGAGRIDIVRADTMSQMSALLFERSEHDRVVAGVCGGLAARLGVDATLVRLVFALLALAGGAGILLYFALWVYGEGWRTWAAAALIAAAGAMLLLALGLSSTAVLGATLLIAGFATVLIRGGSLRPGGSLPILGVTLLLAGAVIFLGTNGKSGPFIVPGAVVGALVLVVGPWIWQLTSERTERIRIQERAEVAARIHDSVLQTLALVQRHASDPQRVASLARRQERELRRWLYGSGVAEVALLVDALTDAAADVEELHGVRVEVASAGDAALDDAVGQLVLAAREAMTNAAKFSGADEVFVYAESGQEGIVVFVRDAGVGFDRTAVPPDRHGIAESIEGRMKRAGGTATVVTARGEGTEVELRLPTMKRRVVLVDDHELFRAGVRGELGDSLEIVGEAGTVAEAIALIRELDPDVVLLDVHLADGGGEGVIAGVAPERPGVKFLALSVSDAAEDVISVIRAGARGYVTKTISSEELADAIERVAEGDAVFSPRLAGFVLDAFAAGERVGGDAELDVLTSREREVLQLIARGYRYKEIAARLHLSVKTVEAHVSSVLRKLQLSSRHELTRWAHERRLVSGSSNS